MIKPIEDLPGQVWTGNEACDPVSWQECKLVPKEVNLGRTDWLLYWNNTQLSDHFQWFPWLTVRAANSSTITSLSPARWRDWPTRAPAAWRRQRVAGLSADQIVNKSPGTNALKFPFPNVHSRKSSSQHRNSSTERNVYSQIPRRTPDHPMRRQYLETWKLTSWSLIMNWTMFKAVSPTVKTVNKTFILCPPARYQWHQHYPKLIRSPTLHCMLLWHTWFSTPQHVGPSTSSILRLSSARWWFSLQPRPHWTWAGKWRLCLSSWWRLLVSPQWRGAQSKTSEKHIPDFKL